jgi:predicted nucleic acid-binding protein
MNLVDSSGWIEFFVDGSAAELFAGPIADPSTLVVPTVCITEVCRFILREDSETAALHAAAAMLQGSVIDLDASLSLLAAKLGLDHSLPLADSIVFATAQVTGATVWTQDADFDGLPGVRFQPKS